MGQLKSCLFIFFSVLIYFANAQESDEINLSELRAPSSPASQILGTQANTITRPKSWNELEISLLTNSLSENGNLNLNDFLNLEISPYWLKKDRKLSLKDFANPDSLWFDNLGRNFSISISSTQNLIIPDTISDNNPSLAIGFRTMFFKGSKVEKKMLDERIKTIRNELKPALSLTILAENIQCNNCSKEDFIEEFRSLLAERIDQVLGHIVNSKRLQIVNSFLANLSDNLADISTDGKDYVEYIDDIVEESYFTELKNNVLSLEEYLSDRKGFKLELAAALAIDFPEGNFQQSYIPQYGFWVTPSFQPYETDWIEFLGVLKYQKFELDFYEPFLNQNEQLQSAFDTGLKLVLKSKRFSLEYESIKRLGKNRIINAQNESITDSFSDNKNVLRINYKISEDIVISYDFGENFDVFEQLGGNLISILSLNYAINSSTKKNIVDHLK